MPRFSNYLCHPKLLTIKKYTPEAKAVSSEYNPLRDQLSSIDTFTNQSPLNINWQCNDNLLLVLKIFIFCNHY